MEVPKQTLTPTTITKLQTIPKETIKIIKESKNRDLSFHPVRLLLEITIPQRNATLEKMQQTDHRHVIDDLKDRTKVNRILLKATQTGMSKLQPKL